ncbi:MAG: putative deacylase [Alphaproteobacteria bacterium]|jgi:predicted deacylase
MEIPSFTFKGINSGKHLLILGAIHGNEVCGPIAIQKIISEIKLGHLNILKGQVTFIPVCNKAAYDKGIRYIVQDLNRCIFLHDSPKNNEQKIANVICKAIDTCDILLDIHSMTAQCKPSAFEDKQTVGDQALVECLHVETIFTGWLDKHNEKNECATTAYAQNKRIPATTLECGQHADPLSIEVAYINILNVLSKFGLIKHDIKTFLKPRRIKLYDTFRKEADSTFTREWKNLDPLKKGDIIGTKGDHKFVSPIDGFIIMPSTQAKPGGEWYYIGIEI